MSGRVAGVVCVYCGRVGSRGFIQSSGNGDGTRDTWACANDGACQRRQRVQTAEPRLTAHDRRQRELRDRRRAAAAQ